MVYQVGKQLRAVPEITTKPANNFVGVTTLFTTFSTHLQPKPLKFSGINGLGQIGNFSSGLGEKTYFLPLGPRPQKMENESPVNNEKFPIWCHFNFMSVFTALNNTKRQRKFNITLYGGKSLLVNLLG